MTAFSVFRSHLLWRRRGNSPLCFSGIWHISCGDCIHTVCLFVVFCCLCLLIFSERLHRLKREKPPCWRGSSVTAVFPTLSHCPSCSSTSWLAPPPCGGAGPPAALPAPPPTYRTQNTSSYIWNWLPANSRPQSLKLLNFRKRKINHPVIKTVNTLCGSRCHYWRHTFSITCVKWNRTWKSHASSTAEMRGQPSLTYQFWTDGLPRGAISPFQLKIQESLS